MALFTAIPAFLVPVTTIKMRIALVVFLCGIPILVGIHGINGDPISVVLKSAHSWVRTRGVMLYNNETVALRTTPLADLQSEKRLADSLIDAYEAFKEARKEKLENEEFIEGVTFEFAEDPVLKRLYAAQQIDDEAISPVEVLNGGNRGADLSDEETVSDPVSLILDSDEADDCF